MKMNTPPVHERVIASVLAAAAIGLGLAVIAGALGTRKTSQAAERPAYNLPDGWRVEGAWETYPADRLYEKINGRAPVFHEYGIQRLDTAVLRRDDVVFDIYVYAMNDPDAALGIYLHEMPRQVQTLNVGALSDATLGQVRAIRGRYYVVLTAADPKVGLETALAVLRPVVESIETAATADTGVLSALPQANRVAGSLVFNRGSAYGLESLADSLTASYTVDDVTFDRVLKRARATTVLPAVRKELEEFGGEIIASDAERLHADFFGKRLMLRRAGDVVVGVYGELSAEAAATMVDRLAAGIEGTADD